MKTLCAALAALLALLVAVAPAPERAPRPDIVLILVDTLRKDHLPAYGYPKDTAPFLTELAARGVVFENAYSASGWTAPATASLFTSLYPFQHGVTRGLQLAQRLARLGARIQLNRLPAAAETVAEALRRRGYFTVAVVENPNLVREMGFDQGFESFSSFPESQVADVISAELARLRPRLLARRPYFLYLHYMDVHAPYREHPELFDPALGGDARRIAAYDSEIRYLDGHLRRAAELMGWDHDTLVVVTGDHGEELGERGSFGHGATLYGEVLNVPLLVQLPGGIGGRRSVSDPVSHVDVLPTLRAAGSGRPAATDEGLSLLPLLRGETARLPGRTLFAHLWRGAGKQGRERALRVAIAGRHKWIGGTPQGQQLFDLPADPAERVDLSRERPELAAELRRRYDAFEARCRKYAPEPQELALDQDEVEQLRALGYVN